MALKRTKIKGTEHRAVFPCAVRAVEGAERTLTFVASTETVASDGDIIKAESWQLERWLKNSSVLWGHNSYGLPIGAGVDARIEKDPPRLEVDIKFAGLEQMHDFAETVYQLALTGFIRAVSVGYRIDGYEKPDDEEKAALGLGPWGVVVTKATLFEVSVVTVGADPDALIKDGQVPREVQGQLLAVRGLTRDEDLPAFDELIRRLPGSITMHEGPEARSDDESRAALADLTVAVRELTEEMSDLREDLRAVRPVSHDTLNAEPARSDDLAGVESRVERMLTGEIE